MHVSLRTAVVEMLGPLMPVHSIKGVNDQGT